MSKKNYYESFKMFWIPIYKKQVAEAKKNKDDKTLSLIRKNIRDNIHLTDKEKDNIYKLIGLMPKKEGGSWNL